jgi:hypothetical protein
MKPSDVNDSMFPIDKVLYDDDEFSVGWGTWDKGNKCLGMRWNGSPSSTYANGFPIGKGGRPIWLVIPTELTVPFVTALLGRNSADNSALLQVLRELLVQPAAAASATA